MIKIELTDNKKFVQILVDEEKWKNIDKKLYSRYLGKIRSCKNKKELSDLFSRLEPKLALGYVYKLLAMRGYLENQLRKKLKDRHFIDSVIETILKSCREAGYLDDTREVKLFIEREKKRGQGPRAIVRRLKEKSGDFETSEALTHEIFSEEEQKDQIQKLLIRRFPDLSAPKTKKRAFRFLQRRGFSENLIREFLFVESEPNY